MQTIRFICTFLVGVNVLTLCYAAAEKRQVPAMHVPVPSLPKANDPQAVAEKQEPLVINTNGLVKDLGVNNKTAVVEKPQKVENVTANSEISGVVHGSGNVPGGIDVGALKRGSLIFLLLCLVILACYAWKTYRLRKASSSPAMVNKYGVRTNRSDIEMRPLPLDEDDDDDTLFEIGNNTNQQ